MENIDKYKLGLSDTFAFKCRMCGSCCRGRDDILLTPRDIFNIAKELETIPLEIVNKYCEVFIGQDSRLPVVRLKYLGSHKGCPLLEGGRCKVHSQKPVVCALFPLGRVMAYEDPNKDFSSINYILNPTTCGSRRTKHTVESWLNEFGIHVEDEFFLEWNTILFYLIDQIKFLEEKKLSAEGMDVVWNGVTGHLYLEYDTGKDFMEQFRENVRVLRETFSKLRILVENAE